MTLRLCSGHDGDWRGDVLRFWFGLKEPQWFTVDDTLDERTHEDFKELWSQKRQLPPESFLTDPLTALAGVILFDQLPRNMFRGHADQFSTDTLALAIAKGAVKRGFDEQLEPSERLFLYMPFQHSEDMHDQRQSVLLFTALGNANQLDFARRHADVIERFGRFPHRNAILGRAPRADEIAAGNVDPF